MDILKLTSSTVWKFIFGKSADSLEKTRDNNYEYMIKDYSFPLVRYVSDVSSYSPAAFF